MCNVFYILEMTPWQTSFPPTPHHRHHRQSYRQTASRASDATALSRTPISFETEIPYRCTKYLPRRYLLNCPKCAQWFFYPAMALCNSTLTPQPSSARPGIQLSQVGATYCGPPHLVYNGSKWQTQKSTGLSSFFRSMRFSSQKLAHHRGGQVCVRGYLGGLGTEVRGGREVRSKGVKVKWDTYP